MSEQISNPSNSSNSSIPLTQNPSSVYFIHPYENPTNSLVSVKFTGDNFGEWQRGVKIALSCKNKIAFIDGTLTRPSSSDDPTFAAWERCNSMVISYLLHSLDTTIARNVIYFTTATEIWKDLEERYSHNSGAKLYSIQQTLHELTQGSNPVSYFFTQIKGLCDQLNGINPILMCTCSGCTSNLSQKIMKQQQEERLIQLLMKLNTHYANVRTNILMM